MSGQQQKNLGQVKALHIGVNPPMNTRMIWYDTTPGINILKYFDLVTEQWINFGAGSSVALFPTFSNFPPTGNPSIIYIAQDSGIAYTWNATTSNYQSFSGAIPFNGNRPISRAPHVGLNVGGANITDFLENFFFPFIPASISINGSEQYEVGQTVAITISGSITLNDETIIANRRITRNSSTIHTFLSNTYSHINSGVTLSSPGSFSYKTLADVDNNGSPTTIESPTKTVSFAYRRFFDGSLPSLPTNSAQVRAMDSSTFSNSFTINIPAGQTIFGFAYPASMADIDNNSVKYVEAFNASVGNTFTKYTFNVNDAAGNPVSYKVWICELGSAYPDNATYNVILP